MLRLDKHFNLLEREQHKFDLQDVQEPNLYRDIFPYTEVPRVAFNHVRVPMRTPENLWMTDTTFRDGQQAMAPYTPKQILRLYDFMHQLGGPKGLIRQSEFFLYSKKDREAVELCLARGYRYPEVTGWIRASKQDFQLVKEMGLKETGILTSASDYHIFLKLRKTRREAMEMYLGLVRAALEVGIQPRCHFEDITRADFYGFVVPFAQELMLLAKESGIPIKIRACDTLGYGVPYPGVMLPRSVPGIVYGLEYYAGVPSEWMEWHGHNDFHKVLDNAVTSWLYGCCAVNGTLLGFGERTGNPPIEALCVEYAGLRGTTDGMDLSVITKIAEYYEKVIRATIPHNYPFVGREFNTTRAGIHADGLMKNEEIYNIFDTETILKRKTKVAVTDKSGVAGIAHFLNERFALRGSERIEKNDSGVAAVAKWVDTQYERGRTSAISDEELISLAREYMPKLFWEEPRKKSPKSRLKK